MIRQRVDVPFTALPVHFKHGASPTTIVWMKCDVGEWHNIEAQSSRRAKEMSLFLWISARVREQDERITGCGARPIVSAQRTSTLRELIFRMRISSRSVRLIFRIPAAVAQGGEQQQQVIPCCS